MKTMALPALVLAFIAHAAFAGSPEARITPAMQEKIDAQKRVIAAWAASPVIVKAVVAQNEKGPIPDMTNRAWKSLAPGDPLVAGFQKNSAGVWLTKKITGGAGLYREAFLSSARGEKVAFAGKPSRYLHAGEPKFDIPMSGRIWQGEPEFDKSSSSHALQIAVPVRSGGRPVGVLVVSLSMKTIKELAR
jgi:hypothetical protein